MHNGKFQKIAKKLEILKKKNHYGVITRQNMLKCWKREKIKIIVPFRSYPTRNIKFQKNSQKIQNIKNYQYGNISGGNRLEKDVNEIK